MRSLARRRPLAAYLLLVYAGTIVLFALPLLAKSGLGVIDMELPGVAPFVLLDAVWLTIAAFITAGLAGGREAVHEYRRRVFRFRVHPGWFALAIVLLPLTAFGVAIVVAGTAPITALLARPDILLAVLVGSLFAFLLVNWWEEAGWTGFALDRLQRTMGPIPASVVTTWLQASVHLPLVFVADGVTVGRVPADQIPFYLGALFILPIPVRIIITWLYNRTRRSVPVVGLYHAGLGVATGAAFVPVLAPNVAPLFVYFGFGVVAVVILVATRGRLGFVARDEQAEAPQAVAATA